MCRILACFVLGLFFCSASQASDEALRLVQTIPLNGVEGRIDHMSITPDGRRLFVAALGNNSVEIADVERGVRGGGVGGIKEPQGVFYIAESKKLAVASGGDGNLRIYDQALKLIGTLGDL